MSTFSAFIGIHTGLLLITGLFLGIVYRPNSSLAYARGVQLHQSPWRLIQSYHYWGSTVLIISSAICLATALWLGYYRSRSRHFFVGLLIISAGALGAQITGNLLPFDRHGVQTASIEGSILARIPVIGPPLAWVALGDDHFSERTLEIWNFGHQVLLPVGLLAGIICLGYALPKDAWKRGILGLLIPIGLAIIVPSPLGSAATRADFGAFDARPSWYTAPLHALLSAGNRITPGGGWLGACLFPAMAMLALIALAIWGDRIPIKAVRTSMVVLGALVATVCGLFVDAVAPLTGTRDPQSDGGSVKSAMPPVDPTLAAQGKVLFNSMACQSCHGPNGSGGSGGPNLSQVGRKHPDADFYMRYIRNPQSIDSSSTMPAFPTIDPAKAKAIAEYLRSQSQSQSKS